VCGGGSGGGGSGGRGSGNEVQAKFLPLSSTIKCLHVSFHSIIFIYIYICMSARQNLRHFGTVTPGH